jgi:elongation factor Ts
MAISASDVRDLRERTGAGMMDCKKALDESGGDLEKAVEWLRVKGMAKAAKRSGKVASEGLVHFAIAADGKSGALVEVNCETDFVAKNDTFVALANQLTDTVLAGFPATKDELLALSFENGTIADKLTEQTGVIGEKIEIAFYERLEGAFVATYIHSNNKLATAVVLTAAAPEAGRDVAMQAAAMNPVSLNKDSVPAEVLERELEIAREQIRQEGKPEEMVEKIAQGKLNKFFKESTLVEQEFIKDSKMTVAQYLDSVQKGLAVVDFRRVGLGI